MEEKIEQLSKMLTALRINLDSMQDQILDLDNDRERAESHMDEAENLLEMMRDAVDGDRLRKAERVIREIHDTTTAYVREKE